MGAWGYGILESDDALDMEVVLLEKLGLNYDTPKSELKSELKIALEEQDKINKIWKYILGLQTSYDEHDKGLAYQVFANMILTTGAKVHPEDFKLIVERTKLGLYNDFYENNLDKSSWTLGRVKAIQELVDLAQQYDVNGGKPIEVPFEGLLDKISKMKR